MDLPFAKEKQRFETGQCKGARRSRKGPIDGGTKVQEGKIIEPFQNDNFVSEIYVAYN